jgi:uroporphyrinogen decarboxylase
VDFLVKDRAGWNQHIRPYLTDQSLDRRRVNFEAYRDARARCQRDSLFFFWSGTSVFEQMHPICGHEHMLMGMALDPDWVVDMCTVLTDLQLRLLETLFAQEGRPDGFWVYEDMGFREHPFMSPARYRSIVWPSHRRLFGCAHGIGCPVVVHSCGYVEPLVADLVEAGMDCLQAIEVKAGMDLVRLKRRFGDRLSFCGGLDIRPMVANDRQGIQAELDRKLPAAMAGSGYILHSDHSVPSEVQYETYRFFHDRGLEMGTY